VLQNEWKMKQLTQDQYLTALLDLQMEEVKLFDDVRKAKPFDSQYWSHGRMEYPTVIAREIRVLTKGK
jgi:hypothetical protein